QTLLGCWYEGSASGAVVSRADQRTPRTCSRPRCPSSRTCTCCESAAGLRRRAHLFIAPATSADMALSGRPDRGWTLHASLILLILLWGLAFVAIKQALAYMSWITLTFLRFAVADVLFVSYLVATRQIRHLPARDDLPRLVILAFFGFTGYHLFLNLGETDPNVSAGTAALIIASAPAFI